MTVPGTELHVRLGIALLPYWTEYAPFLWGEDVNYDSDGDAYQEREPTSWTFLDIRHRGTGERLLIKPQRKSTDPPPFHRDDQGGLHFSPPLSREQVAALIVQGTDKTSVHLAACLTAYRSLGTIYDPLTSREFSPDEWVANGSDEWKARLAVAEKVRTFYGE